MLSNGLAGSLYMVIKQNTSVMAVVRQYMTINGTRLAYMSGYRSPKNSAILVENIEAVSTILSVTVGLTVFPTFPFGVNSILMDNTHKFLFSSDILAS